MEFYRLNLLYYTSFYALTSGISSISTIYAALNIPVYNCEHMHISFAQFSKSDVWMAIHNLWVFFLFSFWIPSPPVVPIHYLNQQ